SFATSQSPAGRAWQELSEGTEAINPRRVGGKPLLDTGRLRGSVTTRVARQQLWFGSNIVYAAAQHFGNPDNKLFGKKPAPLPARPYLLVAQDGQTLIPDEFWRAKAEMIAHWIATGEVRE